MPAARMQASSALLLRRLQARDGQQARARRGGQCLWMRGALLRLLLLASGKHEPGIFQYSGARCPFRE
jgi:hypothetical protein